MKNAVYYLNRRPGVIAGMKAAFILMIMLKGSCALATYYYISTTGTDTNAGDIDAVATIMRAQVLGSNGDTVLIEPVLPGAGVAVGKAVAGVSACNIRNKSGAGGFLLGVYVSC